MKKQIIFIFAFVLLVFSQSPAQQMSRRAEADKLLGEIQAAIKTENFDEVIPKADRILEMFPKQANVYLYRGMAFFAKRQAERAISDLTNSLEYGVDPPLEMSARKLRGLMFYQLKRYDAAIEDFNFVLQKDTADYRNFLMRGYCYFYKGKDEAAIADFDAALKLSPQQISVRRFRAQSYYNLGSYEKAVEDLNEELKINAKPAAETYRIRANAYRKLGKTDLAEIDDKKFVEAGGDEKALIQKEKDAELLAKVKILVEKITGSTRANNFDDALRAADELIKLIPDKQSFRLKCLVIATRGLYYLKKGDYDRALEDFNEAIKIDSELDLPYLGRAKTYRGLGRIAEAEADEKRARELQDKKQ